LLPSKTISRQHLNTPFGVPQGVPPKAIVSNLA
jgi:hypothetical protein